MPMLVTKTYLVDTDDVDEAYQLTIIKHDKIATFAVNQVRSYDPNASQPQQRQPSPRGQTFIEPSQPPK